MFISLSLLLSLSPFTSLFLFLSARFGPQGPFRQLGPPSLAGPEEEQEEEGEEDEDEGDKKEDEVASPSPTSPSSPTSKCRRWWRLPCGGCCPRLLSLRGASAEAATASADVEHSLFRIRFERKGTRLCRLHDVSMTPLPSAKTAAAAASSPLQHLHRHRHLQQQRLLLLRPRPTARSPRSWFRKTPRRGSWAKS